MKKDSFCLMNKILIPLTTRWEETPQKTQSSQGRLFI